MNASDAHQQLFQRLEGLYYALALAVQDPIVIPNPEFSPEADEILPFDHSKVYFNVEDEQGAEIMKTRLTRAAPDIIRAYHFNQGLSAIFSFIEENARQQQQANMVEGIESLCQNLESYSSFVTQHRQRCRENAFLEYPHFADKHISYRRQKRTEATRGSTEGNLVHLAVVDRTVDSTLANVAHFNPEGTSYGIEREMRQFRVLLSDFSSYRGPLWSEIYTGHPKSSYPQRIKLTGMLLREHFNFEVER